ELPIAVDDRFRLGAWQRRFDVRSVHGLAATQSNFLTLRWGPSACSAARSLAPVIRRDFLLNARLPAATFFSTLLSIRCLQGGWPELRDLFGCGRPRRSCGPIERPSGPRCIARSPRRALAAARLQPA